MEEEGVEVEVEVEAATTVVFSLASSMVGFLRRFTVELSAASVF